MTSIDKQSFRALEAAGWPVLLTSADTEAPGPQVLFANSAMAEMTGYSTSELLASSPRILQGRDTDKQMLRDLRQALRDQRPFVGEAVNYRKNGQRYVVEWTIDPIFMEDGRVGAWISIQREITDQRRDLLMKNKTKWQILAAEGLRRVKRVARRLRELLT